MAEMNDVVNKVALLTDRGQIPWKRTADPLAFAATFGQLSVLISLRKPMSAAFAFDTYGLAVLDEEGNELDSATYSASLLEAENMQLESLYNNAKRSALGVGKRLEELMESMDLIAGS